MMEPAELNSVTQSQNIPAALQQMLLGRMHTPDKMQELTDARKGALGKVQNAMRADPYGTYTPTEESNIGKASPISALAQGISAGGAMIKDTNAKKMANNVGAEKLGYEDAKYDETQADKELNGIGSLMRGPAGKQPSPEQLRTVYNGLRNEAAQMSKGPSFEGKTPAEIGKFIEDYANRGMQNYLNNWSSQPTGPRGIPDVPAIPVVTPAPTNVAPAPGVQAAPGESAPLPSTPLQQAKNPVHADQAVILQQEYAINRQKADNYSGDTTSDQYNEALRNMAELRKELLRIGIDPLKANAPIPTPTPAPANAASMPPNAPPAPLPQAPAPAVPPVAMPQAPAPAVPPAPMPQVKPPLPPIPELPPRNTVQSKMQQSTASAMGTAYAKEAEEISTTALAAKEQYDALTNLGKIKPNTNALANVQGSIGLGLQALGLDPNSPMIADAIKNRQANVIVSQMTNAALRGEKGVQTLSDELRIKNEFAKTTDPDKVWNYAINVGKERALRRMEMQEYSAGVKSSNNGLPIGVKDKWTSEFKDDPLTQEYGGRLIFRSQYIDSYMKQNPTATKTDAVNDWRSLEAEYKDRQRSKK
jgi:hypothetical protein